MPTFRSIQIHPSVRSRLVQSQQHRGENDDGGGDNESGQQQPTRSSIVIPRSLLTRDVNDLVDIFSGDDIQNEQQRAGIQAEMENLRYEVAHKMISRTRNGKRLLSHDHQEGHRNQQHKKRKPLILAGSINALDAWNSQQEELREDPNLPQLISTGYSELDNLIAFPAEYFFEPDSGAVLPPNVDLVSGEAKGLPRGYVLTLSGTSGKTQLALQLVSQAMIQSFQQSKGKFQRIRYCYSTAGHSGRSLAQRLFQLIGNSMVNSEEETLMTAAKNIEFQPISTISQLISTIAKLEEEWLQQRRNPNDTTKERDAISMLVVDALPLMVAESEDPMRVKSLERWLKRLARHYSLVVVIITSAGHSDRDMSSDIHLQIEKTTHTTSSIYLLRHPAKCVSKKDYVAYNPPNCNK